MKHKIFIYAIILTLAIPQGVMAYDFSAVAPSGQTLYYNIVNGEAQVTHDGSYSVFVSRGNDYVIGDIVIPSTVTYNDIEYTVTSIEDNAFYGCNFITSVVLPNTITSIGSQSFYGTELVNIIVPDGVASIGNWAFSTVRHIEYHGSASYNSNYQYWSAGSMNGYSEGDFIYYSNSKTYLLAYIGNDVSVSIPSSVTYIGEKAFQYCRNLESVNIHNNVTYIDDQAFSYCSGLTMVNIPGSVSTIGKDAFSESGLASVTIGDGVKTLKYGAFFCCENLTSVNIPSSVTSIGENAFGYCNSLATMTVASGNSHYDSRDNCNAIIESSSNKLVSGCQTTVIPNTVTSIGNSAFYFISGLSSIIIPNSVTTIGKYAFFDCLDLASITIPSSVTTIGESAFSCCYGLTEITSLAEVPPTLELGSSVFNLVSVQTPVYVPCGSVAGYKSTSGWNYFYNIQEVAGCPRTVTVAVNDEAMGSVTGGGTYTDGATVTLTATPNCGYRFVGWKNSNNETVSTEATYSFTVTSDTTVTAEFEAVTEFNFVAPSGQTLHYIVNGCNVTVSYPGSYNSPYSGYTKPTGDLEIPTLVEYNGISYTVTSIGEKAFYGCSGLTLVSIPNSVTSIRGQAFRECSGLTSVTIPNSVTEISNGAFNYCSGLISITVESGNMVYDSRENCNAIIRTAFNTLIAGCKNTVVPNSVTAIGSVAFYGCSGLTSVTIPNSVTSIGDESFRHCSGLTSVTIPNSVTEIGGYAFNNCSSLETITVEEGNAVYDSRNNCNAIINTSSNELIFGCIGTVIPNSVATIGQYAFHAVPIVAIDIPNTVSRIRNYAFNGCNNLTSITLPDSLKIVEWGSFEFCQNLTSVIVNNAATKIENYAFAHCPNLSYVTLGKSMSYLDLLVFFESKSIMTIYCKALVPPICAYSATLPGGTIYVPCDALSVYQTAPHWQNRNLVGMPFLQYEMEFMSENTTMGNVSTGDASCDDNIQLIATANDGYQFVQWSDGTTSNPYFLHVTTDTTVTAFFDYVQYTVTATPANSEQGNVEGGGNYYAGSTATLTATPNCGYRFVQWKNANDETVSTDAEYSFSVTDDIILTAEFEAVDKIALVCSTGQTLYYTLDCQNHTATVVPEMSSYPYYTTHPIGDLVIPNNIEYGNITYSVTAIGDYTFYMCSALTSVTIPNHVTSIGRCAFQVCSGLTSLTIPNSVTTINEGAFLECSGLTSVTISNSISSIGRSTFQYCSGLTSVIIPSSVTTIGFTAFAGCSSLTSVTIPNSVISIGEYAFMDCSSLPSVTIPNSVATIGESAFARCSSLASVIIPNSVTSIGDDAFGNCSGLISVTLSNSVTSIGAYTFYECNNLASITIPNSVTSIGRNAFYGCSRLTLLASEAIVPPTLGSDAFSGVPTDIPVYVPCGSLTGYQFASGWYNFTNLQELFPYTLTVSSNDEAMGTVSLIHTPTCSDNVAQISANAASGYVFVRWSDGNTHTPRTVAVVSDTAIEALFESVPTPTVDCGEYQWPVVPSPYIEVQIKQKHDHLSAYAVLGWDTVVTQNQPTLTLSCMPYVPVLFFNGTYTVEEIPYNPADPTFHQGTRVPTNTDDIFGPATPIPFPFYFFGERKTAFVLGANGLVTFNTAAAGQFCAYSYSAGIPWPDGTAGAPQGLMYMRDAIYGIYEDTYPSPTTHGSTGDPNWGMYYGIQDNMPGRKIVCSWNDIPLFGNTCTSIRNSYQIICYEGTNIIEVHVKQRQACQSWRNGFGIIGIQNATGLPQQPSLDPLTGNSHVVPGSPAAFYPAGKNPFSTNLTEVAYRFTPQGESLYTYKWYRIFDDGRDSVELTTNTNEPNGYYLPMDATSSCPMLTRAVVSPTESSSYVFELRFRTANGDWCFLRDTCRVGVDIPVSQYTVTATSANENMGTVTGGGTYDSGSTATLTATPNGDYRFVRWKNSYDETLSTQRTFDLTVTQDTTLTAIFEEGVQDTVIYVKLGVVGDSIFSKENQQTMVVTHQEVTHVKLGFRVEPTAESIQMLDQNETLIGTFEDSAEPTQIYRLTTGTYIIRAVFPSGDTFQQTINFENVIHY